MTTVPSGLCTNHLSYRTLAGGVLLACGFMVKAPGYDPQDEARAAYSAVLCLRGSAMFSMGGQDHAIVPGTLFQRFAGVRHSLHIAADQPWAECWVHLDARIAAMLIDVGLLDSSRPVRHPGIDLALVRELWRAVAALDHATDRDLPAQLVRLQGLLFSLLGRDDQRDDLPDLDVDRACRLLAEDVRPDLRLVAKELGLGYDVFRRRFKAATGQGPGEYRLRRRLERARAALLSSNRTVADIASELGYANPFTFTALFRRHVGIPPTLWRARGGGG